MNLGFSRQLLKAWRGSRVSIVALMVLAGCGESSPDAEKTPTAVKIMVAVLTPQSSTVSLTGEIKARVQSDLSFRFSGRVAKRLVDVGDRVKAGQVLASLDTTQQEADLTVAQAGVLAAESNVTQLSAAFDRQKTLLKSGFTAKVKYEDAEKALIGAQSALDNAKATLETAKEQLSNATLRAPSDGIITARAGEAG